MKISLKNLAIDVAVGAVQIAADTINNDEATTVNLNVSTEKVSASTVLDIKKTEESK